MKMFRQVRLGKGYYVQVQLGAIRHSLLDTDNSLDLWWQSKQGGSVTEEKAFTEKYNVAESDGSLLCLNLKISYVKIIVTELEITVLLNAAFLDQLWFLAKYTSCEHINETSVYPKPWLYNFAGNAMKK